MNAHPDRSPNVPPPRKMGDLALKRGSPRNRRDSEGFVRERGAMGVRDPRPGSLCGVAGRGLDGATGGVKWGGFEPTAWGGGREEA